MLHKTRKKLSLIFAGIVFAIVLLLGILFLSLRYINEQRNDKLTFISQSNILLQQLSQRPFDESLNEFRNDRVEHFDAEFIEKRNPKPWYTNQVSYLLIWSNNELIGYKILQDIDFSILAGSYDKTFVKKDGVIFRKESLNSSGPEEQIILYMKYNESFDQYIEDLLWYFILSILCGAWFHYIGLLFTGRTLKPVQENMDDMKNFIHNAGHELKTPIAVVDSNLQLLSKMKKPEPELVSESREEISRLNKLVESLVDLADISSSNDVIEIDVEQEVQSIMLQYQDQIKAKNIRTLVEFSKPLTVKANPGYMQIFLSNFIENAIKYNDKKWSLHVTYDGDVLSISDTGGWISAEDQAKIFDRFYQTSSARTGQWFGIWLSLVKKIADIYNWKLDTKSDLWKGTRFDINF